MRCAKTNNHTVREAACQCMAELFAKINSDALKPQLPKLQRTLRKCLKDDSWTVGSPSKIHVLALCHCMFLNQRGESLFPPDKLHKGGMTTMK